MRNRLRETCRVLVTTAALLTGLVTVVRSQPDDRSEPLHRAWSRPVSRLVSLAVSPGGERVVAADVDGRVRSFDSSGELLWERAAAGVDTVSTSRGGAATLAYAARQPLNRQAHFLDAGGRRTALLELPDAIQAGLVSPDGRYAALACGRKLVFCGRRPDGLRHRVLNLPAEPCQIQFGPADTVYVAYRGEQGVALVKSTGKVLWSRRGRPAASCSISASADGHLLAIASENAVQDEVDVTLVNSRNQRQWSVTRPGRAPRVRLSSGGSAVLLAYEHRVEHNDQSRFERRLAYLAGETPGAGLTEEWTKGGAYTAPLYVSVDGRGEWVVALDTQQRFRASRQPDFRLYGRKGERRWIYTSPAEVLIATASLEGRVIATYRADGQLDVLRVAAP